MRGRSDRNSRLPLIAGVLAMVAGACDNPVTPEEHPEAGGVVILSATGNVLAQSIGANVAFDQPLELTAGQTLEVEVLFLDASAPTNLAAAFHPDAAEGESLRVTINDETVVQYQDHDDHGDFDAGVAGQTTAQFELMHGGHADFRSGLLTIIVE